MCMLTEIFVPCYFGSSALEKSKRIAGNIYESNWIEQDKKYKQAFRLFVERTFYPVHIYVHKVFLLDLQTFLKANVQYNADFLSIILIYFSLSDPKNSIFLVCSTEKCVNRSKIQTNRVRTLRNTKIGYGKMVMATLVVCCYFDVSCQCRKSLS